MRNVWKKLLGNIHMNTIHLKNGEWYPPASSTNRARMNKTASCVMGPATSNQKEWIPSKCYLNEQDLQDIWDAQNRTCYWFNIPLDFNLLFNDYEHYKSKHPLAPSVDKKDDTKDYTKDNVVICCRFANFGRNVYPFEDMKELVNLLLEHGKPHNRDKDIVIKDRNTLEEFMV